MSSLNTLESSSSVMLSRLMAKSYSVSYVLDTTNGIYCYICVLMLIHLIRLSSKIESSPYYVESNLIWLLRRRRYLPRMNWLISSSGLQPLSPEHLLRTSCMVRAFSESQSPYIFSESSSGQMKPFLFSSKASLLALCIGMNEYFSWLSVRPSSSSVQMWLSISLVLSKYLPSSSS